MIYGCVMVFSRVLMCTSLALSNCHCVHLEPPPTDSLGTCSSHWLLVCRMSEDADTHRHWRLTDCNACFFSCWWATRVAGHRLSPGFLRIAVNCVHTICGRRSLNSRNYTTVTYMYTCCHSVYVMYALIVDAHCWNVPWLMCSERCCSLSMWLKLLYIFGNRNK